MTALRALAWCAAAASAAAVAAPPAAARQVEHFVVLMQENHSFDNYFGTYPGADGIPSGTCMPAGAHPRPCVRPFHLGGRAVPDVGHDRRMHRLQYAGGRMDGFVRAASLARQAVEPSVMGWYDGRDLPFYWNVAREYVLFDRFFASAPGGSEANHDYWVGRGPGGNGPTIFDRLDARGISWRFYVEDLGPGTQALRVPVLGRRRVVDLQEYYEDLRRGSLPQVAYIAPGGASEHPPGRVQAGQALVRRLLTALWKSDAWKRSAFLWTYDNWGGWYDHVRPPRGRGFRVPALLVSPYARRGDVDGTLLETASIPRFIEDNWDLEPLGGRVREAAGLASAFDFSQRPREPAIVPASLETGEEPAPRRWAIYLGYGGAALLGGALFGWVVLRPASRVRGFLTCLALALVPAAFDAPPARAQGQAPTAVPPVIQTVPSTPGMRFSLGGMEFEAGPDGRAYPPLAEAGGGAPLRALPTAVDEVTQARFDRWYRGSSIAAIELYHLMRPTFVDLRGRAVDPREIGSVTLRGSQGRVHVFRDDRPQWLQGNRVVPESQGTRSTAVHYSAERVMVSGSSVVHRSQQRFFPAHDRSMRLRLLLFAARITVRDALLGFPIGSAVRLEYPNGTELRQELGPDARLTLGSLPRGDYRVSVDALGISSARPVALSRDQDVDLRVVSWLDVALVLLALASVALGLLFLRRPAAAAAVLLVVALAVGARPPEATAQSPPDPLFAYYYIWFNASSWDRAKTDYPLLGRYSSDDREVMRRHVEWAQRAGIDGFIVSWKSTPVLDRRLKRLVEIAEARRFRLLVIYQGLDFERDPLPVRRVASDLDLFAERFGGREVFRLFGKPLVIWSGTWEFTRAEVASVTGPRRGRLLVLASERNEDDYARVADLVDGNAYYWGSVNPSTFPGYEQKLAGMGEAVHDRGGIWIPPAAPGFDARLVGGTEVVGRAGGATLRTQFAAAARSSPDAVGLISWNEFSENTHIEPSREHGPRYLRLVGDMRGARLPPVREFDSSEPAATGVSYGLPLLGGIALFLAGSAAVLLGRARAS